MMDPKYERVRMLDAAISAAVDCFDSPIDRVEVKGGKVIVSSDGRRVVLNYQYDNGYDAQGNVLLGGGRWSAMPSQDEPESGFWRGLFRRR